MHKELDSRMIFQFIYSLADLGNNVISRTDALGCMGSMSSVLTGTIFASCSKCKSLLC